MTKYSIDFKVKVIGEYFERMGCTSLCHKYHIPSDKNFLSWVHRYQTNGLAGIKSCDQRPEYTCNFKLKVLNWMKENHSSSLESTALHFNISSPSTIYQWDRRFETMGVDGLKNKRGRPPMGKHKNLDSTASRNDKAKNPLQSDAQRFKNLELENELLRIENEYLKK
ncbi:helix-turn-helix domain-containing protein [Sporolactobacillus sp. THM19-2]|jgi:transposase|uniref:helix-turn-helix domain-containing protein n=1 Tax=Sporolactobacillus sp. THM19-2 TaxID=2511171 RepID=UPI00101F4CED|nr:helix-turn-helix domain-containing protein [Sporolactobacillus sp. THM19-2]RYL93965.1 transposase [Sporolactobacillus sp. THM19-2]